MALAIDSTVLAALIGAVAVVVVGLLTTWLNRKVAVATAREAARLSQRSAIESQIWDLRRVGYSALLVKLGEASKYADRLDEGHHGPFGSSHDFYASRECRELTKKMWDAWAECEAEFGKHQLIFSEAFNSAFRDLEGRLPHQYAADNMTPDELAKVLAMRFRSARVALLSIAKAEFGLTSDGEHAATVSADS